MIFEIAILTILSFFASLIGTVTGFGTATIMVPILISYYGLEVTLVLSGIVHWFNNVWKILLFRRANQWRLILLFAIPGVVLSFLGSLIIVDFDKPLMARILGMILIGYTIFLLIEYKWKLKQTTATAIGGGLISGLISGIFGIGGAIRAAVVAAYNLDKRTYIFVLGVVGLFVDSARLLGYHINGTGLEEFLLYGMLLFVPASFAGGLVGKLIVDHIPQTRFRILIALALSVLAIKLIILG